MITALIIAIAGSATSAWAVYALVQELRRKQDEINILTQALRKWEDELSAEMSPDFSDWWQNDRAEWPMLTTALIRSLKADKERAWDMALKNKRP
jgi:hypothetical protein